MNDPGGPAGLSEVSSAVVVIDVLRAFTTTAWAFAGGAEQILLAGSLADALALKTRHPDWVSVKDGPPAPGFDTVNSPGHLRSLDLTGRTLVLKTTNGTAGALAARNAPLVLCAGFTVAAATARALAVHRVRRTTFVITGDDGLAEEDLACAQYIAGLAAGSAPDAELCLRRASRSFRAAEIAEGLRHGYPGIHPDDVPLCLEADRFPFAMRAVPTAPADGEPAHMTLRPHHV
ncbi:MULTISPECIES: 2-phosphosulfolactate phosphatase [unclassified Streptomyces]|uniref:2-phosphosulfolactate phosphatase n=1 Tax=unclassified Streptomyces TaxID=2593676 RepID=UPI0037F808E2